MTFGMTNKIVPLRCFVPAFKRFNKKFPSLKNDFLELEQQLLQNPKLGENLGGNLYKIRLANKDKVKGKSAGYRIISYLVEENELESTIYLVKIYDKSEESTVTKTTLLKLIHSIFG
jgi:mRNA-degrading endonuclease RelE of RelBE toxin-antitoxin system